jgi:anti-anti-sigma factor
MTSKDKRRQQWHMSVDSVVETGVTVVAISGRIGHRSAGRLEGALEEILARGARHVTLDLEGVDYISSAGLVVLEALARRLDAADGRLILCAVTEPAMLVLRLAGWADRFAIAPSRAEAVHRVPRMSGD